MDLSIPADRNLSAWRGARNDFAPPAPDSHASHSTAAVGEVGRIAAGSFVPMPFYDELAPYYHLLYDDWDAAINRQGANLAALLEANNVWPGDTVLDAACGIGTQALGLLGRGYKVAASDVSPGAVARMKTELARRGWQSSAYTDDLRTLSRTASRSKAAVIACDNSIPHLLCDLDILSAFTSCYRCLRPGGVAVFSVRDYASVERKSPDVRPYPMRIGPDGSRFLAVQVWEWDGDHYDVRMYLTSEASDGTVTTKVTLSRYYAVSIERLVQLMHLAGFTDVRRLDDALFQPVLTGRRP
jgi:SAM-dependent methyltransferase